MTPQDARFLLDWLSGDVPEDNGRTLQIGAYQRVVIKRRIRRELVAIVDGGCVRETVAETKANMIARLNGSWPEFPPRWTECGDSDSDRRSDAAVEDEIGGF